MGPTQTERVGVRKGIRLENFAPKILMALNNNMGRVQPRVPRGLLHRPTTNRRMGEGISDAAVDDGHVPDGSRRKQKVEHLRVGSWNVGSMSGRSGEIAETLRRRRIAICCVQETRWKGKSARWLGPLGSRYKFMWNGSHDGYGGVGVLVCEDLLEFVSRIVRINDRLLLMRMHMAGRHFNVISAYAPQVGRSAEEKEEFWQNLHEVLSSINSEETIIIGGDLNGHVGRDSNGYEGVHGGMGFGSRNTEGEAILETCDMFDLVVCNTYFRKKDHHLVTYESGGHKSQIDYFMVRKSDRRLVTNVKVIPNEECVQQHRLLVADMHVKIKRRAKRRVMPKLKVWELKKVSVRLAFAESVRGRNDEYLQAVTVQEKWTVMRNAWLEETERICGRTKGPPRAKETWWWNDTVDKAIEEKRACFARWRRSGCELHREQYRNARRAARRAVWEAQQARLSELTEELELNQFDQSIFKVAKRMCQESEDLVAPTVMKSEDGMLLCSERAVSGLWYTYMSRLLNTGTRLYNDDGASPVAGPPCQLSREEIADAVMKSRKGKASGPSGIVAEMVEASGPTGIDWILDLFNAILTDNVVPTDWQLSILVPIYKGKGDPMMCGSYRAIKLLDSVMKIFERVLERRIRDAVRINEMQFGFSPGKGTTDAIFIVRQLQEQHLQRKKDLHMAFIDLEKAFDKVPRSVVQWALRRAGVEEWLVNAVMVLFENSQSIVRWGLSSSDRFEVTEGVHQGSVLSPLLFAITLDVVTENVREGLPWEVLYADDLLLIAETSEQLSAKIAVWKDALAEKGLVVNIEKSKVMRCSSEFNASVMPAAYPCTTCQHGVGANSILCTSCNGWTHKRCSGVTGSLRALTNYVCGRCRGSVVQPTNDSVSAHLEVDGDRLQAVKNFCYLGDMLDEGGGAVAAVQTRIRCGWSKFRELSRFLTTKAPNLRTKAKIYEACVRNCMLYGSETWAMTKESVRRLEVNDMRMARWMCGVSPQDRISNEEVRRRLGIEEIGDVLRRRRLRWFGHVTRMNDSCWTRRVQSIDVAGRRPAGRPKKSWRNSVDEDLRLLGLVPNDALDREKWRGAIRRNRRTQSSWSNRR